MQCVVDLPDTGMGPPHPNRTMLEQVWETRDPLGRGGPHRLIVIDGLDVVEQLHGGGPADGAECIHRPETMWPRAIAKGAGQPPRRPVSSNAAKRLDRVQTEAELSIPQGHFQQGDRIIAAANRFVSGESMGAIGARDLDLDPNLGRTGNLN